MQFKSTLLIHNDSQYGIQYFIHWCRRAYGRRYALCLPWSEVCSARVTSLLLLLLLYLLVHFTLVVVVQHAHLQHPDGQLLPWVRPVHALRPPRPVYRSRPSGRVGAVFSVTVWLLRGLMQCAGCRVHQAGAAGAPWGCGCSGAE